MEVNKEYLLLNFDENEKVFSCQGIEEPICDQKSANLFFPMIYYEADEKSNSKKIYEEFIPQAMLTLIIDPLFGKTKVLFKNKNQVFREDIISGAPWKNKFKVAKHIEDVLNARMSELMQNNEELIQLGIIRKLNNENQNLKDQLKELENLKKENQNLTSAINELNSRWYVRFAKFFKN